MKRTVIIGAGISGLSLAYRLRQADPNGQITVLEANSRLGGSIWTAREHGFTLEGGPNGFLDLKPSTLQLARDLGLDAQLVPASDAAGRHRYIFLDQKLQALPSGPGSFLRSKLLSLRGKLRLLSEPFRGKRRDSGPESIRDFAVRRLGPEAADVLVDALVTGIHGGDAAVLDIRAAFAKLAQYEAEHGSVVRGFRQAAKRKRADAQARGETYTRKKTRLWSLQGGLATLIDRLVERLPQPPVAGMAIRRIEARPEGGWRVRGEGREAWDADTLALTCPTHAQAEMLADLDPELAQLLAAIPYNRIATVALAFRADEVPPVEGFGFIAPQRTRRDILGVQWCSSIFPGRAPDGRVLWRALCGGWQRPEIVDWPDDTLIDRVRAELQIMQGVRAAPVLTRVFRWPRAIPQYVLGHPERVAAIQQRALRHPGLILAGNAFHGISINDCAEQAELLAPALARPA